MRAKVDPLLYLRILVKRLSVMRSTARNVFLITQFIVESQRKLGQMQNILRNRRFQKKIERF